jgi:hypothetical protein
MPIDTFANRFPDIALLPTSCLHHTPLFHFHQCPKDQKLNLVMCTKSMLSRLERFSVPLTSDHFWVGGLRVLNPFTRKLPLYSTIVLQSNLVSTTLVYMTPSILRHIFARPNYLVQNSLFNTTMTLDKYDI